MNYFYIALMIGSLLLGYFNGIAAFSYTKWIAMPVFLYGCGSLVKFIWLY